MSETGTTVLLRGHGSGNSENALDEGSLLSYITFVLCYLVVLIFVKNINCNCYPCRSTATVAFVVVGQ